MLLLVRLWATINTRLTATAGEYLKNLCCGSYRRQPGDLSRHVYLSPQDQTLEFQVRNTGNSGATARVAMVLQVLTGMPY